MVTTRVSRTTPSTVSRGPWPHGRSTAAPGCSRCTCRRSGRSPATAGSTAVPGRAAGAGPSRATSVTPTGSVRGKPLRPTDVRSTTSGKPRCSTRTPRSGAGRTATPSASSGRGSPGSSGSTETVTVRGRLAGRRRSVTTRTAATVCGRPRPSTSAGSGSSGSAIQAVLRSRSTTAAGRAAGCGSRDDACALTTSCPRCRSASRARPGRGTARTPTVKVAGSSSTTTRSSTALSSSASTSSSSHWERPPSGRQAARSRRAASRTTAARPPAGRPPVATAASGGTCSGRDPKTGPSAPTRRASRATAPKTGSLPSSSAARTTETRTRRDDGPSGTCTGSAASTSTPSSVVTRTRVGVRTSPGAVAARTSTSCAPSPSGSSACTHCPRGCSPPVTHVVEPSPSKAAAGTWSRPRATTASASAADEDAVDQQASRQRRRAVAGRGHRQVVVDRPVGLRGQPGAQGGAARVGRPPERGLPVAVAVGDDALLGLLPGQGLLAREPRRDGRPEDTRLEQGQQRLRPSGDPAGRRPGQGTDQLLGVDALDGVDLHGRVQRLQPAVGDERTGVEALPDGGAEGGRAPQAGRGGERRVDGEGPRRAGGEQVEVVAHHEVPHPGAGEEGREGGRPAAGEQHLVHGVEHAGDAGTAERHGVADDPGAAGERLQGLVGGPAPDVLPRRRGRHDQGAAGRPSSRPRRGTRRPAPSGRAARRRRRPAAPAAAGSPRRPGRARPARRPAGAGPAPGRPDARPAPPARPAPGRAAGAAAGRTCARCGRGRARRRAGRARGRPAAAGRPMWPAPTTSTPSSTPPARNPRCGVVGRSSAASPSAASAVVQSTRAGTVTSRKPAGRVGPAAVARYCCHRSLPVSTDHRPVVPVVTAADSMTSRNGGE